jgi:type VI secretion system protein VasD
MRRVHQLFFSFLLCSVFTGCGVTKGVVDKALEDDPPKVVIRIKTDSDVNPDETGRASPIVLRIYELKSDDVFNNADFFALYEEDTTILGDDMTARDEMKMPPDELIEIEKELDMEVRHIGVLAAYRQLDDAVWRGSIDTPPDETTYIDITVGRLTLSVEEGEKKGGFFGL